MPGEPWALPLGILQFQSPSHVLFPTPPACKERGPTKPCAGVEVRQRAEDQHPHGAIWGERVSRSEIHPLTPLFPLNFSNNHFFFPVATKMFKTRGIDPVTPETTK